MEIRNIRRVSSEVISEAIESIGEKKFRVKQIEQWLWDKQVGSFDDMKNISKNLKEELKKQFVIHKIKQTHINQDNDGTAKLGFKLEDESFVESVYIPSGKRATACISAQTGCKLGCKFCATGQIKTCRNLFADEIFDQVVAVKNLAEKEGGQLTNIVYMGMGEPLLNYENVMESINRVTGSPGLQMSPSRITLSTVGIVPGIIRLADDNVKFNLAISLHSADPDTRTNLMPINKKYPLDELSDAIVYFSNKTGSRVTLEYLMLKDVNDTPRHAKVLGDYCKAFPVKINLIEYNAVEGSGFQSSNQETFNRFVNILEKRNMVVNIRRSRGKNIDAACGQLANKKVKNK